MSDPRQRAAETVQITQRQDGRNIYVIMKTMWHPGYHHNGFGATHALGHMMFGCRVAHKMHIMSPSAYYYLLTFSISKDQKI